MSDTQKYNIAEDMKRSSYQESHGLRVAAADLGDALEQVFALETVTSVMVGAFPGTHGVIDEYLLNFQVTVVPESD